jgi:hypothetical protein
MKVMRIAVVAGVLVGLVAATVQAGLFNAHVTGTVTSLKSGVVSFKSFSITDVPGSGTNKTNKLVFDSTTHALEVVDKCGNLVTNIVAVLSIDQTIGPDSKSNEVQAVLLSFQGTGATNGAAVLAISNGKTFKATENFEIAVGSVIVQGKVTTSSAFKPASTCP